eukprot:SAG31_NODE_513_length_14715_cov_22.844554_7_plen_129_part_00
MVQLYLSLKDINLESLCNNTSSRFLRVLTVAGTGYCTFNYSMFTTHNITTIQIYLGFGIPTKFNINLDTEDALVESFSLQVHKSVVRIDKTMIRVSLVCTGYLPYLARILSINLVHSRYIRTCTVLVG